MRIRAVTPPKKSTNNINIPHLKQRCLSVKSLTFDISESSMIDIDEGVFAFRKFALSLCNLSDRGIFSSVYKWVATSLSS